MFTTNAGVIPVKTLLESGKFVVPDFQRNYAWEAKQINEFWNEFNNLPVNSGQQPTPQTGKKAQKMTFNKGKTP